MSPLLQRRISGLIAFGVLTAVATVLISPAVPSAPTLLPVLSALFRVGLTIICSDVVVRMQSLLVLSGSAEPTGPAALEFVTSGLPLRR